MTQTEVTEQRNIAGDVVVTDRQATIQEALNAAMEDIGAVAKNEVNKHSNYNFRGVDAVVNAASPAFRKHGIVVVPEVVSVTYDNVMTTGNKPQSACRVVVAYHFYGPAGDHITATVAGEAWDGGDKATPQAMSVAFRIALLQALSLPTHDPDANSVTYELQAPQQMTNVQFARMQEGFKLRDLSGPENSEGRVAFFKDIVGRETNGGDLTDVEAEKVNNALFLGDVTPEQQANLESTLGAKPIEEQPPAAETKPPTPRKAAEVAGQARRKAEAEEQREADAKQSAQETDQMEGNIP